MESMYFLSYFYSVPSFLLYFSVAMLLLGIFLVIYTWITPHDEFALIRTGNATAAITLGGAIIGFALPVASVVTNSLNIIDMGIWGLIALFVQVLLYLVLRWTFPYFPKMISEDKLGIGVFSASLSIAVGLLNAACMTE